MIGSSEIPQVGVTGGAWAASVRKAMRALGTRAR
jgi:hypothetical protein